jgi:hypothetical protein
VLAYRLQIRRSRLGGLQQDCRTADALPGFLT